MHKPNVDAVGRDLTGRAASSKSGRAAETLYGGHEKVLRQTMLAMTEGTELAEHDSPGDATILMISGRVRLTSGEVSWEGRDGDLLVIPDARHSLLALSDATFILTVAKR
ncbi:MAG: cupin domain-containing protein [Cumulibacter sp.]